MFLIMLSIILTAGIWIFLAAHTNPLQFRLARSTTNTLELANSTKTTEASLLDTCLAEADDNDTVLTKRDIYYDFDNASSNEIEIDYSKLSSEFIECEKSVVEPGCFEKFDNGSVVVPLYNRLYNDDDYLIDETGELYVCSDIFDHFVDDSKFSPTLEAFSLVGIVISTVCITLYMLMFFCVKKLWNLPGCCLFSLSVALLTAYSTSFVPSSVLSPWQCSAVGMARFYFFLASFFWMNTMSYDVWRSLKMATAKLRLLRDRPMLVRFSLYSAYAWGGSLTVVTTALIVDSIEKEDSRFNLQFNIKTCWFHHKKALLVYFAVPFFLLLISNIVFFVSSFVMITSSVMKTAENKSALWFRFLVSLRLVIVMGLTWICGIIALASQWTAMWYVYSILNTLQGLFIFLSFSFTKNTMRECKKAAMKKKSSIFPTQISSVQGTSSSSQKESKV